MKQWEGWKIEKPSDLLISQSPSLFLFIKHPYSPFDYRFVIESFHFIDKWIDNPYEWSWRDSLRISVLEMMESSSLCSFINPLSTQPLCQLCFLPFKTLLLSTCKSNEMGVVSFVCYHSNTTTSLVKSRDIADVSLHHSFDDIELQSVFPVRSITHFNVWKSEPHHWSTPNKTIISIMVSVTWNHCWATTKSTESLRNQYGICPWHKWNHSNRNHSSQIKRVATISLMSSPLSLNSTHQISLSPP